MANLVTNDITLSGRPEAVLRGIAAWTHDDPEALLAVAGRAQSNAGWGRMTPEKIAPEPAVITATADGTQVDLGLAILSAGRGAVLATMAPDLKARAPSTSDWLREKQNRDPFLSGLPPAHQMTSDALLAKLGLTAMTPEGIAAQAEAKAPGAIAAGLAAIRAALETGEFGWYDWRARHWGTRAFCDELRVACLPDGSVSLRFDSVNSAPMPLIAAFAKAHPDLELSGASVEEDNDYAVFFVTDHEAPEGVIFEECHDRDGVVRAYIEIYGHAPAEDEPGYDI